MALNKERKTEKHESFGMAGFFRTTCNPSQALFGSSIKHSNLISFRVYHASVDRHLEQDWFHADGRTPIVEIEMSQTQFAEMITSMNMGDGVPVTIRSIDGNMMQRCEFTNKRAQHANDFRETMELFEESVKDSSNKLLAMINKLPKKDQDAAKSMLQQIVQEIGSNIPFYEKQFQRQMDKTVMEAKGEVESFVQNKITSAGLKALQTDSELPTIKIEE